VLILCFLFFSRSKDDKRVNWIQFFSDGKEAGFAIKEMEQLRRLAVKCNIENPASIFRSQNQLEICIKSLVEEIRMSKESDTPLIQSFLSKLFDYYKGIELKNIDKKSSISTSHQISEGQPIKILLPGTGVFKSEVIKNIAGSLTVSRPVNSKITTSLQWNGLKISIYFWREDDAGYVFDTVVVDEVFSKGFSALKVDHCDTLFRTQKRKSLRVKLKRAAYLYPVDEENLTETIESEPGLCCMLDNISDTGCAFMINGQASSGLRLKVQFGVNKMPVCIIGTVRSVEYNKDTNSSLIRMEADPLPHKMRNRIMSEVFHMLPEENEEELPYRIIEQEIGAPGKVLEKGDNSNNEDNEDNGDNG
jgi:c-di-GMP-binding flagellar brake protein YcgR